MDVIKSIEENVEEGEEELKELAEKGKKIIGKAVEEIVEKVEEDVGIKPEKIEGKSEKTSTKSKKEKTKEIKKEAKAESTTGEKYLEKKKKELLEKAKKLKEKLEKEPKTEELKEKIKIKKKEMLVPLEEYVKSGIYLGTKVVTPKMRQFVYRRRADGLAIFNTDLIDEKLREGINYLSKFAPEDIIVICKRDAGWKAVKKFSEITGIRAFTKKYPAGILTNKTLPDFFENELTIITDQWVDKNALNDTLKVHKKVLMICDTNNFSKGADQIILGNNKSPKSLGLIFYLLAKGYCKARGIKAEIPDLEWWTGEAEEEAERKAKAKDRTKEIIAEAGIMTPQEGYGV
jgi:small subunit ribosomal protein S2